MYSKEKIFLIAEYCSIYGEEKTLKTFDLKYESLTRILRDYKNKYHQKEKFENIKLLKEIENRYSKKELQNLASGNNLHKEKIKLVPFSFEGNHVRFAALGDTHFGSIYSIEEIWTEIVKEIKKSKCEFITHDGDVVDGLFSKHEGQIYELHKIGYDAQKQYAIEMLSMLEKPIYIIDGNHDRTFMKSTGANIVKSIVKEIKNCNYIGSDEGFLPLDKIKIELWHGEDSSSYAHCFDDKTEILTNNGWKMFENLNNKDLVATLNPIKQILEFEKPKEIIKQYYSGDMIHFDSQRYDCMITPNHRMYVYNFYKKEFCFQEAKNIKPRQYKICRIIPNYKSFHNKKIKMPLYQFENKVLKNYVKEIDLKYFMEFLGWYISEGNLNHKNKSIEIAQYKNKNYIKYKRIEKLISNMGYSFYSSKKKIIITSIQLYNFMKNFNLGYSYQKYIPKKYKLLDKQYLLNILDGLFLGDGTIKNNKYQNYTTASRQLADDIQEILLKCGISCCIKKYINKQTNFKQNHPIYQLSCSYDSLYPEISKINHINYDGFIYCVSTNNGIIMTRRNGKVIWTGNSYRVQKIVEAMTGGQKPDILLCGHTHKSFFAQIRHVQCISTGAVCTQSKWMRSKRLENHTGFWIIDLWINKNRKHGVAKISTTWHPVYN